MQSLRSSEGWCGGLQARPRRVVTIASSPHVATAVVGKVRRRALLFPAQFWLLVGGTFLYLAGYEIGYPFETVYLHSHLGVSMTAVGLILGLPILVGLPFQIAGGAIADRFGRKVVLVLAICAGITLFEGLALAHQLWQVVTVIAIEAACGWAMYLTANNAMLADLRRRPGAARPMASAAWPTTLAWSPAP